MIVHLGWKYNLAVSPVRPFRSEQAHARCVAKEQNAAEVVRERGDAERFPERAEGHEEAHSDHEQGAGIPSDGPPALTHAAQQRAGRKG